MNNEDYLKYLIAIQELNKNVFADTDDETLNKLRDFFITPTKKSTSSSNNEFFEQFASDMIEEVEKRRNNKIKHIMDTTEVKDGTYSGLWGGWVFTTTIDGKHVELPTPTGVRGMNIKATATVVDGVITTIK